MFLFVFYFQGAQGDSPIDAGIKLTPLALGMLIASPLAGIYADRHGSRALAAHRDARHGRRAGGDDDAAGTQRLLLSALWLAMVGVGSGMFNSPNTAAMMGVVPRQAPRYRGRRADAAAEHGRGAVDRLRARDRHLLDPKSTLFAVFSGLAKGLSASKLDPFIANMHVALWVLSAVSLLGAGVCLLRPAHDALKTQAAAATDGVLPEGSQGVGA